MGLGRGWIGALACGLMLVAVSALGAQDKKDDDKNDKKKDEKVVVKGSAAADAELPGDSNTEGSVTVGGQAIAYKAVAGTLTVGSTDPQDATLGLDGKMLPGTGVKPPDPDEPEEAPATARMFYVAYFKKNPGTVRPVTFLYNGGPGSSTM